MRLLVWSCWSHQLGLSILVFHITGFLVVLQFAQSVYWHCQLSHYKCYLEYETWDISFLMLFILHLSKTWSLSLATRLLDEIIVVPILFLLPSHFYAILYVCSLNLIFSIRGGLKSPWSGKKRKRPLTRQQWNTFFLPDGKLRGGGVKFLKKVRSGVRTDHINDICILWTTS